MCIFEEYLSKTYTMKNLLLFFSIFLVCSLTAQEDLDDIFDDGQRSGEVDVIAGTDVLTFSGGTPNIYGEFRFKDKVGIQVGVGMLPFGYLADFSNPGILFDGDLPIERDIRFGSFYNVGFKYFSNLFGPTFDMYYYADFKRWKYRYDFEVDIVEEFDPVNFRRKFNFGVGYNLIPFDHIGFDFHLGIFMGRNRQDIIGANNTFQERIIGFDVGLCAFYRL